MDYEENFERLRISDEQYDSWTRDHQPYVATFELLPNCNFECIHCYLGVHRQEKEMLSLKKVKHVLDELQNAGVLQLALTGGECTLRKDFPEIYRYAKKLGFIVTVFTNASNITDDLMDAFCEFPPFSVEISLYGASRETYRRVTKRDAFDEVMSNIEKLYRSGIHFSLKTPLIKQNADDEEALEKIAKHYDLDLRIGFAMSPTIDKELYPEEYAIDLERRFLHEINNAIGLDTGLTEAEIHNPWGEIYDRGEFVPQYICNPGVSDVFVDYKGYVCPCIAYRNKGISLFEKSFEEIWKSFRYFKEIPVNPHSKCMRCQSRYLQNRKIFMGIFAMCRRIYVHTHKQGKCFIRTKKLKSKFAVSLGSKWQSEYVCLHLLIL